MACIHTYLVFFLKKKKKEGKKESAEEVSKPLGPKNMFACSLIKRIFSSLSNCSLQTVRAEAN